MYAKILKANPYHGKNGRFTSKDKAGAGGGDKEVKLPEGKEQSTRIQTNNKLYHVKFRGEKAVEIVDGRSGKALWQYGKKMSDGHKEVADKALYEMNLFNNS